MIETPDVVAVDEVRDEDEVVGRGNAQRRKVFGPVRIKRNRMPKVEKASHLARGSSHLHFPCK